MLKMCSGNRVFNTKYKEHNLQRTQNGGTLFPVAWIIYSILYQWRYINQCPKTAVPVSKPLDRTVKLPRHGFNH